MAGNGLEQILSNNGFSYCEHPIEQYNTLIVKNMKISEIYQQIKYIVVIQFYINIFVLYIHFEDDYIINKSDFHIDLSMYNCSDRGYSYHLWCKFNENSLIEELHRLNPIGLNIKHSKGKK